MATTTTPRDLRALLQSLPQELHDEIYDCTFTPNSAITNINTDYRPPSQAQVDRTSRATFKKILHEGMFTGSAKLVYKWLESLPKYDRQERPMKIRCWVEEGAHLAHERSLIGIKALIYTCDMRLITYGLVSGTRRTEDVDIIVFEYRSHVNFPDNATFATC